jgi:biotin carboxyl carrier protein
MNPMILNHGYLSRSQIIQRSFSTKKMTGRSLFSVDPYHTVILPLDFLQIRCYSSGGETIKVPTMGDSITEGRIIDWNKKEGESVNADEVIVSIETDKVRFDVRAPTDGVIVKTLVNAGDDVRVGQELFVFQKGAAPASAKKEAPPEKKGSTRNKTCS